LRVDRFAVTEIKVRDMFSESSSQGLPKTEEQHRQDICLTGRWMYERGFIVACEGNLSVRLDAKRILTTPTGMNKGMLTSGDLVITDLEGRQLDGTRKVSSELGMHLLIYRLRPDVLAICHAHPPTATGFAAAGRALDQALLPEVVISLGLVPLARYGTPGTPELSDTLEPYVPHYDAILLANHGVVTFGPELLTAFYRMETVEQFAKIALVSGLLGNYKLLSGREVAKLIAARSRYGCAPPPGASPELPVTAEVAESGEGERINFTPKELEALIDEAVRKDRSRR
jgi:L-fuculose-phosphate aldolase